MALILVLITIRLWLNLVWVAIEMGQHLQPMEQEELEETQEIQ